MKKRGAPLAARKIESPVLTLCATPTTLSQAIAACVTTPQGDPDPHFTCVDCGHFKPMRELGARRGRNGSATTCKSCLAKPQRHAAKDEAHRRKQYVKGKLPKWMYS